MEINYKPWIYMAIVAGILCLITISCKKIFEEYDHFQIISLEPLTGDIPFEELGSGIILFKRLNSSDNSGLYIIDVDQKSSYGFDLNSLINRPCISPGGSKIACSLRKQTNNGFVWGIYCMNNDGTNCIPVMSSGGGSCPSWSPDGIKILYYNDYMEGPLYMLSATKNSSDRVELTKFYYGDDPYWWIDPSGRFSMSPDGQLVCASKGGSKSSGILKIEPYTGKPGVSVLVPDTTTEEPHSPVFSPDGTKIAFAILERDSLMHQQAISIKTMNPDGTNITSLARVEISYEAIIYTYLSDCKSYVSLCWSPDGEKLLFNVPNGQDGCFHLMAVNADGSGLVQVTDQIDASDYDISWGGNTLKR